MIRLHHLNQSRSLRIMWLLEELGVDYELVSYKRNATTRMAPPELLKIHPLGKSPLLEIDGKIIGESAAIVEVICEKFAPHMIPNRDGPAYLEHLELMHFAEGSVMTPLLLALYTGFLGDAAKPLQPRIESETVNHFQYMEDVLRRSGHFVLDELSAVDIMMSFPASIMVRQGRTEAYPKLAAFMAEIQKRPAFPGAVARDDE
jgi:glutathione S-transferase